MNRLPLFTRTPLVSAILLALVSPVQALPVFNKDKDAQLSVSQPSAKELVVTQKERVAVGNWTSFSILADETVRFVQADANAVAVNKVLGQEPSSILGRLSANGRVFLINPNGIVFGADAQVNVGELVASTLALSLKDDSALEFIHQNSGAIEILGTVEARHIALLAPTIRNWGTLIAKDVKLIAASQVTANADAPLLAFQVKAGHEQALIEHLGRLDVPGGTITLMARSDGQGALSVLNTTGLTEAANIVLAADQISLGTSVVARKLTATATDKLTVAGVVQGDASLQAGRIEQVEALRVDGRLQLKASDIRLTHEANEFGGVVSLDEVQYAALSSRDHLRIETRSPVDTLVLNSRRIGQSGPVAVSGQATFNADEIDLSQHANDFSGPVQVLGLGAANLNVRVRDESDLSLSCLSACSFGDQVGGLLDLKGPRVTLADLVVGDENSGKGGLNVEAASIQQSGALVSHGDAHFKALAGTIDLRNRRNAILGDVSLEADRVDVFNTQSLNVKRLVSRGGDIQTEGRLVFKGDVELSAGEHVFVAQGSPFVLNAEQIAELLPPSLDVYSARQAVDPITGLGRISLASAAVEQQSGLVRTGRGTSLRFTSPAGGSVVLAGPNQMDGVFSAGVGSNAKGPYSYDPAKGVSALAINNETLLRLDGDGVQADVVSIRSRGLVTLGDAAIRARMPYNDLGAGSAQSYPGLTLSLPPLQTRSGPSQVLPFGEAAPASGVEGSAAGALRVEIGETRRRGLGGYLTVLPVEGAAAAPGQVVYLAGPENAGIYGFYYDGARSLSRIPVSYNGSLLLSPQESTAIISAQGALALARQEQTRSVVRTENVESKAIQGVIVEAGPGRAATLGQGTSAKPLACDAASEGSLSCSP